MALNMRDSLYPDGTKRNHSFELVIPERRAAAINKVYNSDVQEILCHRKTESGHEQYLVHWKVYSQARLYSWHDLEELSECLAKVQSYLNSLSSDNATKPAPVLSSTTLPFNRKRKSPDSDDVSNSSESLFRSSRAPSVSSISSAAAGPDADGKSYNGVLEVNDGRYSIRESAFSTSGCIVTDDVLPTEAMLRRAQRTSTYRALNDIRAQFLQRLNELSKTQVKITLVNDVDQSVPPLDFEFISKSRRGYGVEKTDGDTIVGCGPNGCRPNMGQHIGCEYGRKCECLEFAAVDESKLTDEDRVLYEEGERAGLPKRFPYHNPNGSRPGCLVNFYLESRHPIYECNLRCNCGPLCKTRVVQHGRQVPLEIFKTTNRGWGLRCTKDLKEGQFIDTYRGEIITSQEADYKEERAPPGKASYLYNLDKHVGDNDLEAEDCYVVDGEFMGGPTRFMNHSCDPNCRQYTVSYNKFDIKKYELAFFAYEDIPAGTELTFDYLDKDDEEENGDDETLQGSQASATKEKATAMTCKCGAKKCRGKLWM